MTKKEHKKNYGQVDNPDSLWQRSNSARKVKGDQSKPSLGGKEIMQMLDIEDDGMENIYDVKPLKMMDIVLQTWNNEDPPGPGQEEEEHEEEDD